MKPMLKSFCILLASAVAVFSSFGYVYAQKQDESDSSDYSVVDDLENHRLAGELLRMAEAREDVWLAIAAARMLNEIPGGVLLPKDPAGSKADPSALAKLDDKSGKAAAQRSIEHALKLASRLAGDDEKFKAEIAALGSSESKWSRYTCYTYNDLGAQFYWTAPSLRVARTNAMRACQYNTPYGYSCYHSHCN